MSTIVTRSGKGAALTHVEVDANFTNLNTDKADASAVILATQKGAVSGVCPLDATSKVASTYLPSYVDDVLEYANYAALPATGETGKIYVALDTNKTYRWSGSAYIYITSGAVDSVAGKTGVVTLTAADVGLGSVSNIAQVTSVNGTAPIVSSGGLTPAISISASTTLVAGSMSAADKTKLDAISGTNTGDETLATIKTKLGITTLSGSNTGDQTLPTTLPASDVYAWAKAATKPTYTATEVGLGSVNNTSDTSKPISTATQTALDLKAPLASPTFTGTVNTANLAYTGTLTGGTGIVAIGTNQIYKDASGNVGIGTNSVSSKLTVAGAITITGAFALRGSYGGGAITSNFAAGDGALGSNTTGYYNTSSGVNALFSNTTGYQNTASGRSALSYNTTGTNNSASGVNALYNNTTGSNNSAVGMQAGMFIADGSTPLTIVNNSTYIGFNTKASDDIVSDETVIGYNATGSGSHSITLGGSLVTKTIIPYGNLGIGNPSPNAKLDVATTSTTAYGLISQTPIVGLVTGNTVNMAYFSNSRAASSDGLRIINYRDSTGSGVSNWQTESYAIERNIDNVSPQSTVRFGTNYLRFDTAGTERMRIDSSGNVSIPTGQLTVTKANDTATGGGQLYLNGATGNRIDFNTAGVAPPAFTTRSVGTKIVLYPNISATSVDFALGIESNALWTAVPGTSSVFKWYGGTTLSASLLGTGDLNLVGNMGIGGAIASTSGTGITFPATQAASTNANTLDDYEEGTWTPVLTSGFTTTGTPTMSGVYTKIGRSVTVSWLVQATSNIVANGAVLSGLPFSNAHYGIGLAGNNAGTTVPMSTTISGSTLIFGGVSVSTPNLIGSITYITTT